MARNTDDAVAALEAEIAAQRATAPTSAQPTGAVSAQATDTPLDSEGTGGKVRRMNTHRFSVTPKVAAIGLGASFLLGKIINIPIVPFF